MAFKILKMYRVGVGGGLTGIGLEDDFLADLWTEFQRFLKPWSRVTCMLKEPSVNAGQTKQPNVIISSYLSIRTNKKSLLCLR